MFNFFTTPPRPPDSFPKKLLDSLEEGVVVYGADFEIKQINQAAEKILNINSALVVGKKISPADLKTPEIKNLVQLVFPSLASAARVLSEPGVWPQKSEMELGTPPKTLVISLLRDEAGAFFKIIRDLSGKKLVERTREEFIAVAAHQIRTPLTALHWAMEQLKGLNKEPSLTSIIEESLGLSERTLKIANDLLDAAQIEDGRLELSLSKLELKTWAEKVVKEFQGLAATKKISMSLLAPEQAYINADESQISMVLANLVDNAIKYNLPGGRVEVSIKKEVGFYQISIKDTGLGLPANEKPRLFEKLYRGTEAVRVEPNGSGLGLYIAKNIIEKHGGQMGVDSEVNRGSTFWFTLPEYQETNYEGFRL